MRWRASSLILLIFVLFQSGCGRPQVYVKRALLMGTFIEVQIVPEAGMTQARLDGITRGAFSEIRRLEGIFSLHRPDSELARVNRLAIGEPCRVSKEFMYLLEKALEFSDLTGGAFDVSATGKGKVTISEENSTVRLEEGVRLDFGGIAKGYAVDRVTLFLEKEGVENAIVNAGGDMRCLGRGPDGAGWKVGIRHPRQRDSLAATLLVRDKAVATSGDYERPFHIIDPKTGEPLKGGTISSTVLAEDCLAADALATAVFVLGPESGMELIDGAEDIEGVIISRDLDGLEVDVSRGLKEIEIIK